ncbi:hypothetical protein B0O99DRAFT_610870, partial [Bisporella sp. PMI_857]
MSVSLVKRSRAKTPHARGGCPTCKKRHVKCDQTKPDCNQCTKVGWKCDYPRPTNPNEQIRPLFEKKQEYQGFSLFRTRVAAQLSSMSPFELSLWNHIVLQACEPRSPVTHAVIAYALSSNNFPVREVLLTVLLCTNFEALIGSGKSAAQLTLLGVSIIEQHLFSSKNDLNRGKRGYLSSSPYQVEDELVQAFGVLEMFAMEDHDNRLKITHEHYWLRGENDIEALPDEFATLSEGELAFNIVGLTSMHWIASVSRTPHPSVEEQAEHFGLNM